MKHIEMLLSLITLEQAYSLYKDGYALTLSNDKHNNRTVIISKEA